MRLTRASSYALHAVAYMAQMKSDRPVASHKIAQEHGIAERLLHSSSRWSRPAC